MPKTILIIDDDPIIHLLIERMMIKQDPSLKFIHCKNGKVGLDTLNNEIADTSQCIILLDLNMPVLNGWGFLDALQSNPPNTFEKVILYILSSSTDKDDLEKSKSYLCVKKFYHKPLNFDNINEILFGSTN